MNSKLRVATVGAGYFSQFHYDAWDRLDIALAAICDADEGKARAIAEKYGIPKVYSDLETMLDNERPDLLDIITPPATHLAFIRAAADRGVPAICQKPFPNSLQEAEQAVEVADQAGTVLVIHENFRFQPWYGKLRRLIDAGKIGTPYQVTFRLRPGDGQGPDAYLGRQPYFQKMERFLVHEAAIHLIDVFRFLYGEMEGVMARLARLNPAIAGEDAGIVLFDFANGTRGLFDGNRLVDHAAENRRLTMGEMILEGAGGILRLDGDGRLFFRAHGSNDEEPVDYRWDDRGFGGDCVYRLQRHVIQHLGHSQPLMNTAREYLNNLRIEEAIYESHRAGRRILL